MKSQYDIFLDIVEYFLISFEYFAMHQHLELQTLIKIAIRNDLDDNKRQRSRETILSSQHSLHFHKIDPELLLTYLIVFLS